MPEKKSFLREDRSPLVLYETEEQKDKPRMKYLAEIVVKYSFRTLVSMDGHLRGNYLEKQ